jgi:hypothetical protein
LEALKTLWLRQLLGDLLGACFLERNGDEATLGLQDFKSALRFGQITAKQQQDTSMPRRERRSAIKGSLRASGVGMVVDRWMTRCLRPAGAVQKALIGISPAGIQHGEPGEHGEVHKSRSLAGSAWGLKGSVSASVSVRGSGCPHLERYLLEQKMSFSPPGNSGDRARRAGKANQRPEIRRIVSSLPGPPDTDTGTDTS